jgi:hypothetical protein
MNADIEDERAALLTLWLALEVWTEGPVYVAPWELEAFGAPEVVARVAYARIHDRAMSNIREPWYESVDHALADSYAETS